MSLKPLKRNSPDKCKSLLSPVASHIMDIQNLTFNKLHRMYPDTYLISYIK